ncbi:MAG: hypothetical protein AAF657_39945 [Acidobacteriota bacterium]
MSTEESFSEIEEQLLEAVPVALKDGVALLEWWQEKDPNKDYKHHYPETKTLNRPEDTSYGFFDSVKIPSSDKAVAINGNVQEMFYDDPKSPPGDAKLGKKATELMHEQIREFILTYFMRVSDFRQPELAESDGQDTERTGFGFSQEFYKRQGSEAIGRFAEGDQEKIVDLRDFKKVEDGQPYEWIVLKNPIFGFGFNFKPFNSLFHRLIGVGGPQVKIPADVFNYLVISPEFVVWDEFADQDGFDANDPHAVRARYGFGYAFVNDPEPSVYGYGPGQLQPAFEQMVWEIDNSGVIKVRAAFVAQEPRGILELSVDPLAWGFQFTKALGGEVPAFLQPAKRAWDKMPLTNTTFDPVLPTVALLNLVTGGQAKRFGLSKDDIIKEALFIHFQQHYQTIVGSLQTWRQIKDWTSAEALPSWVVSGRSS